MEKKCKLCGVKAIEGQDLCRDCRVRSKFQQEKPIFDGKEDLGEEGLEVLKKMFGM